MGLDGVTIKSKLRGYDIVTPIVSLTFIGYLALSSRSEARSLGGGVFTAGWRAVTVCEGGKMLLALGEVAVVVWGV